MPEYDDATLEQIMREGLDAHAGRAATQLAEPMPPELRLTRGRPWLWPTAVAAAVLVVIGGVVAVVASQQERYTASPDGGPSATTGVDTPGVDASGWRTESYAGVQLRVPPSWGLGAGPVDSVGQGPAVCADDPAGPYVGRPVFLSDMCVTWHSESGPYPKVDAVWFDSPLGVGSSAGTGRQAVTRAVGGQHVTVFTDDTGVRDAILGSLAAVAVDANGCSAQKVDHPGAGVPGGVASSMSVCAYVQGDLIWSGRAGQDAANSYGEALQRTSAAYDPGGCQSRRGPRGNTSVELGLHESGGATRWDIVDFDCQQILAFYGPMGTDTVFAPLVPATVEPWALPGIKAYVTGPVPASPDLAPYFRGMLG